MSLISHFKLMADYNQTMNKGFYAAAASLSEVELTQDRGAFFGSILGTLNHILVGDIIWLKRFSDHPAFFKALAPVREIPKPPSLDAMLYADLDCLMVERVKLDQVIKAFSDELTGEVLQSPLSYYNMKGESQGLNFGYLLQHFFNHQTHHRGQVSTLLSQAGAEVGVTDLLVSIPRC